MALTDWYLLNRVELPAELDADFPRLLREDGERLGAQGPAAGHLEFVSVAPDRPFRQELDAFLADVAASGGSVRSGDEA